MARGLSSGPDPGLRGRSHAWTRRPGVRLLLTVLACLGVALAVTRLSGPPDSLPYRLTYQAVATAGLGLVIAGAWRDRTVLGGVGLVVVGAVFLQYVGDIGMTIRILAGDDRVWPSWTDPVFLASYVALIAATLLMVHRREQEWDGAALIDALIITVGFGVPAFALLIADAFAQPDRTLAGRLVAVSYLVCDVLLVGVVARLLVASPANRGPAVLLACAVTALLIGDLGFAASVSIGTEAAYAPWVDTAYLAFYPLFGAAMRHIGVGYLVTPDRPVAERLGRLRLAALAAGALLAPATLLVEDALHLASHVREVAVGAMVLFLLVILRMSRLVRAVESKSDLLEVLSRTDALTGLANRRTFDFELDRTMTAARGDFLRSPVSLVMIDIDRFKAYNDVHGHGAGDRLLAGAAKLWSTELELLAPAATLARYGGEEFAIVLPGVSEGPGITVVERLRELTPDGQSFSAGIAQWDGLEEPGQVFARADRRLYEAKAAGRSQVKGGAPLRDVDLRVPEPFTTG